MPSYRILYLRESEVDRFRHSGPKEQPHQLSERHYDEAGRIDAPGAYAAWKELQGAGAEERGIREMGVGDLLEPDGQKPLLCNFWGFEEAEWRQQVQVAGAAASGGPGAGQESNQIRQLRQVYS